MNQLLLATNSKNKVVEIEALLSKLNVKVNTLQDLNLNDEIIENGTSYKENALIKAKYGFEKTGLPTLADDSGFCIEALNNFPGVVSARFIDSVGSEQKTFEIIDNLLKTYSKNCHYITYLVFIYKGKNNKTITKEFEGKIEGQFTYPPKGGEGFGYDPVFTPNGYDKTFAEMFDIKKQISQRTIALKKFLEYFENLNSTI